MASKTIPELLVDAGVIRGETADNANTADRIGEMLEDIIDSMNPNRGTFVGTTAFPSTGGRHTGGAPRQGDRWKVITTPIVVGGNVYAVGTIVEAAVNGAGATTLADWIKYAVQE